MSPDSIPNWKLRALGIGVVMAPFLGIAVRLMTASSANIAICGLFIWLYGAAVMAYLARRMPPPAPGPLVRVLLWTMVPFAPVYLASVLVTGSLMKR